MTLELLKKNISREAELTQEISELYSRLEPIVNAELSGDNSGAQEKSALIGSLNALAVQLQAINDAIPELVNNISFYKSLTEKKKTKSTLVGVEYSEPSESKKLSVAVKKKDEAKFLESLASKKNLSKPASSFSKQLSLQFIGISNKMFRKTSDRMIEKIGFEGTKSDLKKIASVFSINSYLSMALFGAFLAFFFGLFAGIVIFALGLGISYSIIAIFAFPAITFLLFLYYPSSTRRSLEKEINQELPFVTIYMAAISSSGIEPNKIFDILSSSKDYPSVQRELKKLTNYVNFYGYDLSSALKITAKNCPSERLAQLFEGFSTTITSGGSLTEFLNKHSEGLLFDYRLEREKYTKIAETFMNIYISVVIAAPMVMMMLFILMSLANFGVGLNPTMMGLLTVLIISLLNFGFLIFLNMKQPKF